MSRQTIHTITIGGPDDEDVEITFSFLKGAPEQGPSYSSGGQPADPDEVEIISVTPIALTEWAEKYFEGDGYDRAIELARNEI